MAPVGAPAAPGELPDGGSSREPVGRPGPLATEPWFALVTARTRMRAGMDANAALEPLGLTLRTYAVLSAACTETGLSQRETARHVGLDERQVVQLIADLVERGLVTRCPHPSDGRVRLLDATDEGRAVFARAAAIIERCQRACLAGLTPVETAMLIELLGKITDEREDGPPVGRPVLS